MRTILTLLAILLLATPSVAQNFTWNGWFGPPESPPLWSGSWPSEGNNYTNGWGNIWHYSDDPTNQFPESDSWVLIPAGMDVVVGGQYQPLCGDLTIEPGATVSLPFSQLSIFGPNLNNNGLIHATRYTATYGTIDLNGDLDISGNGEINLGDGRFTSWATERAVTVGSGQLIHGAGGFGWEPYGNYHGIALTNNGVIRATNATSSFSIFATNATNNNLLESTGEATLILYGNWDNSAGEIIAKDESEVWLGSFPDHPCQLDGGILRTTGSGEILPKSYSSTKNVTLEGTMRIERYTTIHMSDVFTNNGYINQGVENWAGSAIVQMDSALTFVGDGLLRMGNTNAFKMYNWPDHNALFTNGANHTIESLGGRFGELPNYYGDQRIQMLNEGTIICQAGPSSSEFRLTGDGFINRGTLEIQPNQINTARIWGDFHQTAGRIECDDVFRITDGAFDFTGGVIAGQSGLQGSVSLADEAIIQPGDESEAGTFHIWGPLTLNQGATLVCEWGHTAQDLLAVHGLLTTTGTVHLRVEYLEYNSLRSPNYTVLTCDDRDDQAVWTVEVPAGWTYDSFGWVGNDLVLQGLSGMATDAPMQPEALALHGAAPNPFNPQTQVSFSLNQEGLVQLWIADLAGRRVRILVDEIRPAGQHRVMWNGCDQRGRSVSSGTYLCVMNAGGEKRTSRMTLVR